MQVQLHVIFGVRGTCDHKEGVTLGVTTWNTGIRERRQWQLFLFQQKQEQTLNMHPVLFFTLTRESRHAMWQQPEYQVLEQEVSTHLTLALLCLDSSHLPDNAQHVSRSSVLCPRYFPVSSVGITQRVVENVKQEENTYVAGMEGKNTGRFSQLKRGSEFERQWIF